MVTTSRFKMESEPGKLCAVFALISTVFGFAFVTASQCISPGSPADHADASLQIPPPGFVQTFVIGVGFRAAVCNTDRMQQTHNKIGPRVIPFSGNISGSQHVEYRAGSEIRFRRHRMNQSIDDPIASAILAL